jgi:hypothetical protein
MGSVICLDVPSAQLQNIILYHAFIIIIITITFSTIEAIVRDIMLSIFLAMDSHIAHCLHINTCYSFVVSGLVEACS